MVYIVMCLGIGYYVFGIMYMFFGVLGFLWGYVYGYDRVYLSRFTEYWIC